MAMSLSRSKISTSPERVNRKYWNTTLWLFVYGRLIIDRGSPGLTGGRDEDYCFEHPLLEVKGNFQAEHFSVLQLVYQIFEIQDGCWEMQVDVNPRAARSNRCSRVRCWNANAFSISASLQFRHSLLQDFSVLVSCVFFDEVHLQANYIYSSYKSRQKNYP